MKLKFLAVTSMIYFPNTDLNVIWKYKLLKFLSKSCKYSKCNLIVTFISNEVRFIYKNTIKCNKTYLKVHDNCLHDTRRLATSTSGYEKRYVCFAYYVLKSFISFRMVQCHWSQQLQNPYSHFIIWWHNTRRYRFLLSV